MTIESPTETRLRLDWMEKHFKLGERAPFAELRAITLRVEKEKEDNRKAMLPGTNPRLNFKFVDDLTARIQARKEGKVR